MSGGASLVPLCCSTLPVQEPSPCLQLAAAALLPWLRLSFKGSSGAGISSASTLLHPAQHDGGLGVQVIANLAQEAWCRLLGGCSASDPAAGRHSTALCSAGLGEKMYGGTRRVQGAALPVLPEKKKWEKHG